MRYRAEIGVVLLLASLSSCSGPAQPGRESTRVSPPLASHAERPMAQRREAQLLLDSARFALGRGNRTAAIALLRRAAPFFAEQATTPPTAGSGDLIEVSRRLEQLTDTLRPGYQLDARQLDLVSAYANVAEAERHGALASLAWATRSKQSACDELLMAADHTERAAADAGVPVPPALRVLVDTMRILAGTLAPMTGSDIQAMDEPLVELHMELQALRRRLALVDSLWTTSHGRKP